MQNSDYRFLLYVYRCAKDVSLCENDRVLRVKSSKKFTSEGAQEFMS